MIKLFEQFNNEQEIHEICKKYDIENYTINSDGSIDVSSSVYLFKKKLKKIPIKFNKVSGNFNCSGNILTTLENSPNYVDGIFDCSYNKLTSLDNFPNIVNGSIDCSYNQLTSLEGICKDIDGVLLCRTNKITTLKGFPNTISDNLWMEVNPIKIIDESVICEFDIFISHTDFDDKIKSLSQDKLRILFEHGVDYDIFDKNGTFHYNRLERMFKDFNI